MRFTRTLLMPQNVPRLRDASWQRWRIRKIPDDGIAAKLEKTGIRVIDANEFVRDESPLHHDIDSIPDTKPLYPQPPKLDSSHPLWKDRAAKVLTANNFPMEGVMQAQFLSKSIQVESGLPEAVLKVSLTQDQDHLVQNVIKQAYIWDAHLDKQPRLRSLEIPCFSYKSNYQISPKTSNEILLRNFLRLIQSSYPQESSRTLIGGGTDLRLNIEREAYPVQFRLRPMISILSKHLLDPVLKNPEETTSIQTPDISPFNSVANFEEENVYDTQDSTGYKAGCEFPYIHTSCFTHEIPGSFTHVFPRWNSDRYGGSTVLYGFTTAALMAKKKYGDDVKVLPEPITTQTVHLTGKEWQFSVFQLNSLDLDTNDGVKNVVWLSDRIPLFSRCGFDYKTGKEVFEGYNPTVFNLLAGIYHASTTKPLPPPPSAPVTTQAPTNVQA